MTWQEEITSIVVQAKLLPQTAGEARHLCATIIRGGEKWVSGVNGDPDDDHLLRDADHLVRNYRDALQSVRALIGKPPAA